MVAMVALHRLHVPSGRRPVAVAVPDDDRPPLAAMPAVVFPLVLVVLVMLARVLAVVAVGPLAPPVPAAVVVGERGAGERERAQDDCGAERPKDSGGDEPCADDAGRHGFSDPSKAASGPGVIGVTEGSAATIPGVPKMPYPRLPGRFPRVAQGYPYWIRHSSPVVRPIDTP